MAPRKKKEEKHQFALEKIEGVGPTRGKRLEEHGVKFIHDLCLHSPQDIARITGLDKEMAEKLCRDAKVKLEEMGVIKKSEMSAAEELKHNETLPVIHSGCDSIDSLFGGGIRAETTSEFYGEFGTGKSQFAFTMLIQAMKDGHNCIFVDCEKTYDVKRVAEIAISKGYYNDLEEVVKALDKQVIVKRARDSTEVMDTMNNLTENLIDKKTSLLIVDGAVGRYRSDYAGREELSARQMALKPLMNMLGSISDYFPIVVIFTNQVLENAGQFFGDPTKPVGGHIVGHAATYRIYLRKAGSKYFARMIDSPHHAKQDVQYDLTVQGVVDIKEVREKRDKKTSDTDTVMIKTDTDSAGIPYIPTEEETSNSSDD